MTANTVDARSKPCPQPVIETRKALADPAVRELCVLVDNHVSAENVRRMASSMGCAVRVTEEAADKISLRILRQSAPDASSVPEAPSGGRTVVLVSGAEFGSGEKELGAILMRAFVKTIKEVEPLPQAIIFINSGIFLTTEGSAVREDLEALVATGVQVCSCGTCLDYYHRKDKLEVGIVSNMFEILTLLTEAGRVIRP